MGAATIHAIREEKAALRIAPISWCVGAAAWRVSRRGIWVRQREKRIVVRGSSAADAQHRLSTQAAAERSAELLPA